MLLEVHGKNKTWDFEVNGDTKFLEEWRDDELDINPMVNIIPEWIVNIGLLKPWCFFQDIFHSNYFSYAIIIIIIILFLLR